jgi:SagB-type dehydrogenase family enzyme
MRESAMTSYRTGTAASEPAWSVGETVSLDDPAELYHAASALTPTQIARQLPGAVALRDDPGLRLTVACSTKRHPQAPAVALPDAELPRVCIGDALRRCGSAVAADGPLGLAALAALLRAGGGLVDGARRAVPSAGGLYPCEVYVLAFAADGVAPGLYHYDPFRHVLELLRAGGLRAGFLAALPEPASGARCPAALVVSALFRRSRFAFGQRGYRNALLEAGHLVQNLLLAAAALDLAALPVGTFYDRQLAELLALDGVDEAPLYAVPVGARS